LSEKDLPIHLDKSKFYNCIDCRFGAASKIEIGETYIVEGIKCSKCINKICRDCDEIKTNNFAIPYQLGIDQEYYEKFFQCKVPWFRDGIDEETRRKIEGEHPNRIKDVVGNGKVLDVANGQGWLVGFLRELDVEAYGIDYSEYAIENAFYKSRPYIQLADSQNIPYPDNTFDMVIARELLEHLTVGQVLNTIKEMDRVCKPEGILYFTIWLNFDPTASPDILCSDSRDQSHVTYMPRQFWLRLFERNFPYLMLSHDLEANLDWMNKGRAFVFTMRDY
jgi:SAM-dependent methyltransferase